MPHPNFAKLSSGPPVAWLSVLNAQPLINHHTNAIAHQLSLLDLWISRGCHLDPAQTGALDCPLHQPRRLGLLDEVADVRKPSGPALRDRHRYVKMARKRSSNTLCHLFGPSLSGRRASWWKSSHPRFVGARFQKSGGRHRPGEPREPYSCGLQTSPHRPLEAI